MRIKEEFERRYTQTWKSKRFGVWREKKRYGFFLSEKVKCEMKFNKEIKSVKTTIRKLIL